ncbi:mitochondrial iron-sulfur cluster biosynthesis Nfs1 (IscS) (cysteine desulfurase) [Andalucia godoyi]|uniref:cysteine desulfurase n=1 Tax=Andalucia godoyi TaxID=505711 RepID=A0A8K0F338_ANDGO|nr:mitochondrial iron-sulfur cluster biosynthesis Nfs1 (IscS) (cysteine desulfurase) [Andalucia godoyi]|eukprot:ANDGO_03171.mRNA.1 mitochondrial iron-sulfur cluster biosynthesis Nfs1 (IscS) (cysteine desulfurase)
MTRLFPSVIRSSSSLLSKRLLSTSLSSSVSVTTDEGRSIYLDLQATTPVDPRVLDAMIPLYTFQYGNPHSRTHMYGWETQDLVEQSREQVATLIGASPTDVVFTSGATESNNASIKGLAGFYGQKKRHIITTQIEHKCVLDSCRHLEQQGFKVTYLPVSASGIVDLDLLKRSIQPDTLVVSVMAVNNEIGAIQDMPAIGKLCRENKVFFHVDAAQAVGKIPVDVNEWNCDLMSISGHKVYGPKGIGALYVRRKPRVRLEPIIHGGGQERGLRSGTIPAPLVVGFGTACKVAKEEMTRDSAHITKLARRLYDGMTQRIQHVQLNGPPLGDPMRYCGNVNLSFSFVEGESLLMALRGIAVSSGSACTSASLEPSYVLRALGVEEELAHTSIRFGIGRFTTEREVDFAIALCAGQVDRLRQMSPLWEMVQEGIDLKSIQWSGH